MKILVTGGAGFIGSNVVDTYIAAGHKVVILDNLSTGSLSNIPDGVTFYPVSIESKDMDTIIKIEKPDIVNHHAAQKSVPASVENPLYDLHQNAEGFLNLLESSVRHGVRKVIFASSGGALAGDAPIIPTDETYVPRMISPYAIHKYLGEQYLHFYAVTYGLKYTVLRYANVYGPRQVPDGESGVIPIFITRLLADQPCTLYAYADQPDGTTRDYVYVSDVCQANLQALTHGDNESFNIGSGTEMSTSAVYQLIADLLEKRSIPLNRAGERKGDVKRSVLDIRKAAEKLDWRPNISLQEGLKRTLEWQQQFLS